MKHLILVIAFLLFSVSVFAQPVLTLSSSVQLTQNSTERPFQIRQEFGGDGSLYTLMNLGGMGKYYAIPWGFEFEAGWNILVGKRTSKIGNILTEVPAYGGELYIFKTLTGGMQGMYAGKPTIRFSLRGMLDGDQPDGTRGPPRLRITAVVAIGWAVKTE